MQITERRVGNAVILDLVGELTYANRATFKSAVDRVKQPDVATSFLTCMPFAFWTVRHSGPWRSWLKA